jgi:hypothetical protein
MVLSDDATWPSEKGHKSSDADIPRSQGCLYKVKKRVENRTVPDLAQRGPAERMSWFSVEKATSFREFSFSFVKRQLSQCACVAASNYG